MKIWLIKHKPSGHYLAEPYGRNGRGGSHVEPNEDPNKARICRSLGSAKAVLGAWLKGKWVASRGGGGYADDYEFYEDISIIPVPSRNREDMEIVEIEVQLP